MSVVPFGITFLRVQASAIYNIQGSHEVCQVQLWIGPFRNIEKKDAWCNEYRAALAPLRIQCTSIQEQVLSSKIAAEVVSDICPSVGPVIASLDTRTYLSMEYREKVSSYR